MLKQQDYAWAIYNPNGELWAVNVLSGGDARFEAAMCHRCGDPRNSWKELYKAGWRVRKVKFAL